MKVPQIPPAWKTGIYIGNGVVAKNNSFPHQYECSNCNDHFEAEEPPHDGVPTCDRCREDLKQNFKLGDVEL